MFYTVMRKVKEGGWSICYDTNTQKPHVTPYKANAKSLKFMLALMNSNEQYEIFSMKQQ